MDSHRFILEPYRGPSSRHTCPNCGKPKTFSRYIDTETNQIVGEHVGRCNRENKCGYLYTPGQFFKDKGISVRHRTTEKRSPVSNDIKPISFIDDIIVDRTWKNYEDNNFVKYLKTIMDPEKVDTLVGMYRIGTSKRWGGGTTVFWQIDNNGKIRTGKLIKFDPVTGKRIKLEQASLINWAHSVLDLPQYHLKQCLFGEHFLSEVNDRPIAIVESEKTAVIAQARMPDYIWLATGGKAGFNPEMLKPLKGRIVTAFPDLGAYDDWLKKANQLDFEVTVFDFFEKNASKQEIQEGYDIADYLVKKTH